MTFRVTLYAQGGKVVDTYTVKAKDKDEARLMTKPLSDISNIVLVTWEPEADA